MENKVTDSQELGSVEPSRDEKDCLKAVVSLSAIANQGKTTTLLRVSEKLIVKRYPSISTKIHSQFQAFFPPLNKKRKPDDIRIVVPYQMGDTWIYFYIATKGDDEPIVKENIEFFKGKYSGNWYEVDPVEGLKLNKGNVPVICPRICVSACRTEGNGPQRLRDYARVSYIGNLIDMRKEAQYITEDCVIRLLDQLSKK